MDVAQRADHFLVFGDSAADRITFGPIEPEDVGMRSPLFFRCPIRVWVGPDMFDLAGRGGVEGYALANLRESLASLRRHRRGSFWFGDHDYAMLVLLAWFGDDVVRVTVDLPAEDRWGMEMPSMTLDGLLGLVDAVNELEEETGPLIGACEACGAKPPLFSEEPYQEAK